MHGNHQCVLTSISTDVTVTLILAKLDHQALANVALTCKAMHELVQIARGQMTSAWWYSQISRRSLWEHIKEVLVCEEPHGAVALLQLLHSNRYMRQLRIMASSHDLHPIFCALALATMNAI